MKKTGMAILAVAMTLQGCSDPKKANKANFETAFENFMKTAPADARGLCYRLDDYDSETNSARVTLRPNDPTQAQTLKAYEAMVRGGVFSAPAKTTNYFRMPEYSFPLTASSKQLLANRSSMFLSYHGICVGQLALDEVIRWSEPAEMSGIQISHVNFKGHYENLPAWTHDPDVIATFPDQSKKASAPFEFITSAVLMNDGWSISESEMSSNH